MTSLRSLSVFLLTTTAACAGPSWLDDVEAEPPESLSDVGVYRDLATLEPGEGLLEYEPIWPLWSSGTDKQRLVHVPKGALVDTQGSLGWDFPAGTVLAKTFSAPGGAPIETRVLFRRAAEWEYAVYLWGDDGASAELLPGNWLEVPMEVNQPSGEPFPYTVPARLDCRTCHETSQGETGTVVLGLSPFQLPPSLEDAPFFGGAAPVTKVSGRTANETAALGYFVGNCVACHNGGGSESASFSLYPEVAVENTVDHPTESETGDGTRVVPGDPESSVLFVSVVRAHDPDYGGPFKAMPPLGISRPDPAAKGILGDWISELTPEGEGP